MIPADYITEWRKTAPWILDAQVEQDLVISRALTEIFSNQILKKNLAFRGGTALHKLYLNPPARYSEDIDLVQIKSEPIGNIIDQVRNILDPWLGSPKRKFGEGIVSLNYRFLSEGEPPIRLRLKIEINTREHFSILGWKEFPYEIHSRWFTGTAQITTYSLNELLGTKLRALYQRKKGRDLFDLWMALKESSVQPDEVIRCFSEYLKFQKLFVSKKDFEDNLDQKSSDGVFMQDIAPLLPPDIIWEPKKALATVRKILVQKLPC